ncbi:hypothetical protein ABZP36_015032 [Zizania latifolia]
MDSVQTNAHGGVGQWVDGKCVAYYKASAAASSSETQILPTSSENSASPLLRFASPRLRR